MNQNESFSTQLQGETVDSITLKSVFDKPPKEPTNQTDSKKTEYWVPKNDKQKVHGMVNDRGLCTSFRRSNQDGKYDIFDEQPAELEDERFCSNCFPEIARMVLEKKLEVQRQEMQARLQLQKDHTERCLDIAAQVYYFGIAHDYKPSWTILTCENLFGFNIGLQTLTELAPKKPRCDMEMKLIEYKAAFTRSSRYRY